MTTPTDAGARPRWRTFAGYLRERFNCRVRKVPIDGGFTCPNRDGTRGVGGCAYCANESFSPACHAGAGGAPLRSIREQVARGIALARRAGAEKVMVYFQSFSNTYAPLETLRARYDEALADPDIVALAVGTRPDCIDAPTLELLSSYAARYEVWLELGLQSAHDETLARINRCHTAAEFFTAAALAARYPLKLCAHIIAGLPGESARHARATAEALATLRYHGLKLHPLHIVAGTALAGDYARGGVTLFSEDEYVSAAADVLERTPSDVIVQRLAADALPGTLVAPAWCANKHRLLGRIDAELARRGTRQGSCVPATGLLPGRGDGGTVRMV